MNSKSSTRNNLVSPLSFLHHSASVMLAGALVATALIAGPAPVYAASEIDEPVAVDTSELEARFWTCDYVASTRGVDGSAGMLCQIAFDELKIKRFGGSFERLLEWWNANKAEQYAALDRGLAEVVKGSEAELDFPESI